MENTEGEVREPPLVEGFSGIGRGMSSGLQKPPRFQNLSGFGVDRFSECQKPWMPTGLTVSELYVSYIRSTETVPICWMDMNDAEEDPSFLSVDGINLFVRK